MVTVMTVSTAAAADPAEQLFRWKLKPGQSLKFRMVQDMTQNIQMGEQKSPMTFSTKTTMDMDWKVDAVDDKGEITMDQTIQRIQLKTQGAQGVLMEYDSAAGKEPEGLAKMVAPMLEAMLKKPFRATFTSRGELKKIKLPAGMVESLNKSTGGQMGNFLSEDSMKRFGIISVFPEKAIKPGETWTQESTIKLPMIGNQVLKNTFRYEGRETRNGGTLEKLALTQTMKSEDKKPADENQPAEKKEGKPAEKKEPAVGFTSMEGKGFLLFDNSAGHVVEASMDMKMKMNMDIMGQKLTQDMTGTMVMSPLPADAASTSTVKEK